ncbi:MAG: TrmO family methyltransferase [Promethearchaeota archaeon]
MSEKKINMNPIGYVRIKGEKPEQMEYFLDIHDQYRTGLKELDKFSHVMVFWWASEMDDKEHRNLDTWAIEVPYAERAPDMGIFASRAEYRPNPIALTMCEMQSVDIKKRIVKIRGIDTFNETPILVLKAYFPTCDRVRDCHIAPWLKDWPEYVEEGITWWQEQGFFEEAN